MSLPHQDFIDHWKRLPESQEPHAVDTAWRRYQHVHNPSYITEAEEQDPSPSEFRSNFQSFLEDFAVANAIAEYKFITLPANRIPWTASGIKLRAGQTVSTFASGRVWRSRVLDMWLRPQFALWFKVGINGLVFNSTKHSNTFQATEEGELYTANQFPGQFGEPSGGRLATPLTAYDKADGQFEILIITWKDEINPQAILSEFSKSTTSPPPALIAEELTRLHLDAHPSIPPEWTLLWFLGKSSIYTRQNPNNEAHMHCKPHLNTGILQKNLHPPFPFRPRTWVAWDWLITSLPSRLREDLTFTHDYLSVAFEFENGRDLTYTWSWELPREFGYWCPLPAWADREYHVVIRTGTEELGEWRSEERDLYADYVRYVEEGKEDVERIPKQIVRAWFIAGNRWQRFEGEMTVRRLRILNNNDTVDVL